MGGSEIATGLWGSCIWRIADGVLAIGPGIGDAVAGTPSGTAPWANHAPEIRRAVVGSGGTCVLPPNCSELFAGLTFLEEIRFEDADARRVSSAEGMFRYCVSAAELDFDGLDLPDAGNLSGMFEGCSSLGSVPGLMTALAGSSPYDTSSMFARCKSLESISLTGGWTHDISAASRMFEGCTRLTEIRGIERFAPRHLRDMSRMFMGCPRLRSVDLMFPFDDMENMEWAFRRCKSLSHLALHQLSTLDGIAVDGAFEGCEALTEVEMPEDAAWEMQERCGVGVARRALPPFPSPVDFRKVPCDEWDRNLEHYVCNPAEGVWLEINLTPYGWEVAGPDRRWEPVGSFAEGYTALHAMWSNRFDGIAHPFAIGRKVSLGEITQMLGSATVRQQIMERRSPAIAAARQPAAARARA